MRHGLTSRGRAREHSDDSELLPAWSVPKQQLQEEQEVQVPRELEEQPWRRMAEADTCKCNRVEGKARKRQAKLNKGQ